MDKHSHTEMVDVFKEGLQLSKVHSEETVAILTQDNDFRDYAVAIKEAAKQLGASVFEINLPKIKGIQGSWGVNPLTGNQVVIDTLKKCDLLVDLVTLLWSKEQMEIQKAGTRVLLVHEPFDVIKQMFPKQEDKEKILVAKEYLSKAKTLKFTNDAGTDVTYNIDRTPVLIQYGFADEPGRWDHISTSLAATMAKNNEVNGKVVLKQGDIIYPFNIYVRDNVVLSIKDGFITEISGGFEADLIRDYMEQFNDPRAYAISHIGWGVCKRANWSDLAFYQDVMGMQGRCYYGNVLFSTGPNNELGGDNDTHCHLDIPMKDCTLYLDDEIIVNKGEVLDQSMVIE